MAQNQGKKWEEKFKESWIESFPKTTIFRLADQQSYYKGGSSNPCDFIALPNNYLYLIELKSHKGNTFPFEKFRQYDLLLSYKNNYNTKCCLIIWFIDHNKVLYIPIEEIEKMKLDNKKSVNIKMLQTQEYNIIDVPCEIKRIYPKCNWNIINE